MNQVEPEAAVTLQRSLRGKYTVLPVEHDMDTAFALADRITVLVYGRQMRAIGRPLTSNPRLLILDEATEGPAPLIRIEIWRCLERLKDAGLSMIVIDKHIGPLMRLADRHYILKRGRVVWHGTSDALRAQPEVLHQFVGV
jgi:ABC-type branched-subunit amino acid transport system ATPase component